MPVRPTVPPPPASATAPRSAPAAAGRWPRLASRLQVRHRFAALGVVGALMCALPLLQVLRYQADAISAVRSAQSSLNPLMHAVDVQRGLVLHRDVAGAVLRGAGQREPERRQHQTVVNQRLTELELALRVTGEHRASQEGQALREDWTSLSRRVEERSLAAVDSDAGHRLLVEQTLQIIDDLGLAALDLGHPDDVHAWRQAALHSLPRLSARLGLLRSADAGSAEAHPREFVATQRLLAQQVAELRQLPAPASAPQAQIPALNPSLAQALANFEQRADDYFLLQRNGTAAGLLQAAAGQLASAEAELHTQVQAGFARALDTRLAGVQAQRQLLLGALGLLAALGLALGLSLLPPPAPRTRRRAALRRFDAQAPAAPDSLPAAHHGQGAAPGRVEARHLLQRLRAPSPPSSPSPPSKDTGFAHTAPPAD